MSLLCLFPVLILQLSRWYEIESCLFILFQSKMKLEISIYEVKRQLVVYVCSADTEVRWNDRELYLLFFFLLDILLSPEDRILIPDRNALFLMLFLIFERNMVYIWRLHFLLLINLSLLWRIKVVCYLKNISVMLLKRKSHTWRCH